MSGVPPSYLARYQPKDAKQNFLDNVTLDTLGLNPLVENVIMIPSIVVRAREIMKRERGGGGKKEKGIYV